MRTTLKTAAVLAAAFSGMLAGTASAQDVLDAKIPFAFVIGNQEFSAGLYEFTIQQRVLALRGTDNGAGMFALTLPADGRDPQGSDPVLVFSRYENTYRLAEIWSSPTEGLALFPKRDSGPSPHLTSNTDRIFVVLNPAVE